MEEVLLKVPESSSLAADKIPLFILKTGASIIAPSAFILLTNRYLSYTACFLETCIHKATA